MPVYRHCQGKRLNTNPTSSAKKLLSLRHKNIVDGDSCGLEGSGEKNAGGGRISTVKKGGGCRVSEIIGRQIPFMKLGIVKVEALTNSW